MGVSLVSNPPYNMAWKPPALAGFMPQYQGYPLPPESNANYAFILTGLHLIDDKAVFLLPNGCLTPGNDNEKFILKLLLSWNLISAIITLPDSMFESTDIPVCMMVLDKHKETQKIEMINMKECYEVEIRDQNGQFGGAGHTQRTYHKEVKVIPDAEIEKAIEAIRNLTDQAGFCKAVSPEQVKNQDYMLTPSRYIDSMDTPIQHRSFEDIANDYNRIIQQKNQIKIRMNRTAAKRLGFDCLDVEKPDLSKSFEVVGQTAEKEDFISFTASDGIQISVSTKEDINLLIIDFLQRWKTMIMFLNNEENRLLAEFRDALLPELMSGKIEVK